APSAAACAAVALRCALRGYLSHYLSLRNLIVPQRRSEASHKVLLRRVSCFAAKRGLIARERPRPASLGLRPIHLQKTLTVSLRAKCRRPAAVALRCALRGYLSHYLSLRNLIVPQRRSAASHKVLLRRVSCFAAK